MRPGRDLRAPAAAAGLAGVAAWLSARSTTDFTCVMLKGLLM